MNHISPTVLETDKPVEVRVISFDGIMPWEDVRLATSYSRKTIWKMEKKGLFPRRRQLSPGRVGWMGHEVLGWIQSRPCVGGEESCEIESGEAVAV